MSRQGTIKRYTLIIEKINRGLCPTLKSIEDYLFDHGFKISKRTLQRNIEQIRNEFGIEITYDPTKKGYYIDKEKSIKFDAFLRFLEIASTAEILTESIQNSKKTLEYISFDNGGTLEGINNLKHLLKAIKEQKAITFTHYNFSNNSFSEKKIYPYLLKEYMNRWYIVGLQNPKDEEFRTFGVDRISNLSITTKIFQRNEELQPSYLFENTVGLVYGNKNIEEVILKFTPFQGKYIKTLPIHKSQEIISDTEEEFTIRLWVNLNHELKQRVLMYSGEVEVIKPKQLRNEIIELLTSSLKRYK